MAFQVELKNDILVNTLYQSLLIHLKLLNYEHIRQLPHSREYHNYLNTSHVSVQEKHTDRYV